MTGKFFMKTLRLFVIAFIAFIFFSCNGLNLESNRGSIAFQLPYNESQTREPTAHTSQNLAYIISIYDQNNMEIDRKGGNSGDTVTFENIIEGHYIVRCNCFLRIDNRDILYAHAEKTAEVKAGERSSVTLYLQLTHENIPPTEPKQEENVPDYIKKFEGAETVICTTWDELADTINTLGESQSIVCSLSGTYDATSQIIIKFGRKVLLTASADTTINANFTSGDLFSVSSGVLIVAGTKDANITFTGEMSNSIFNVDGSKADLTVVDNVDFENFTCTNQYAGGAVYVAQGVCSINGGVTFTNCKATKSNGGAINAIGGQLYVTGETLENPVTFNNCSANKDGGAIYINASEHRDGYIQLSDIIFGSEEGKENICGTDYYSRDIYINSIDEVPVYLTGNFRSIDNKVEIFAASYFILGSETETTADLNITFDSNFFDEAISNDMQIIFTDDTCDEDLLNHIKVRSLSSPDWKRIDENGYVITD